MKHQTELDPLAAFIKNSRAGRVNPSKQGNGDRAETESRKQSESEQAENNQKRDQSKIKKVIKQTRVTTLRNESRGNPRLRREVECVKRYRCGVQSVPGKRHDGNLSSTGKD